VGCGRWKKKGGSRRRAAWPHSSEDGEPDAGQRRGSVQSGVQRRTVGTWGHTSRRKGRRGVVGGTSAHGHATAGTKRGPVQGGGRATSRTSTEGPLVVAAKRGHTVARKKEGNSGLDTGSNEAIPAPRRREGRRRWAREPSGGRGEGVSADGGVAETSADRHGRRRLWRVVAVGRWPPRRHGKGLRPAGVVGTGIPTLRRTPELGYWEGAGPAVEQLVREGRHAGGVPEGITPGAGTLLVYPCGAGRAG